MLFKMIWERCSKGTDGKSDVKLLKNHEAQTTFRILDDWLTYYI